jgi:SAM-dependent methyltransferase
VTRDVGAAQPEHRRGDEPDDAEEDAGEQGLGHAKPILPSAFVEDWIGRLRASRPAHARALDVAMGRGRHVRLLADAGYRTFGVDIRLDVLRGVPHVRAWCADLTQHPLPRAYFDLIVVARYLQRDLFGAICGALKPGGVVLYETFTTAQRALGTGPRSADHLLEPGELRAAFDRLEVLFYEEVERPEAVARIAARRVSR